MGYKHKSYSYILVIFALLFLNKVNAQSKRIIISGVITSKTDSEPLIGATVAEKDADNRFIKASVADFNGNFSIEVSDPNNTLTFSYIGFKTQFIVPGEKRKIDVQLVDEAESLDAVELRVAKKVFNGDFEMDKKRVATAISTISTKEISETSPSNIFDQIQGRLSGVDIANNSGDVGSGLTIRIRGTASLNAEAQPLIVINGVIFDTQIDDSFDFASADEQQYSALIGVSANDIEEISVLKDAAATAQYGSAAANGVLLIKTKRGEKGKAQFSYAFRSSVGFQPDGIPLLNGEQYSTVIKEELHAVNNTLTGVVSDSRPVEFDPTYELYDLYNDNVNWLDEITRVSIMNEHNIGISGGGEKSRYRVSGSYKDQVGTTLGNDLKQFTARAILDYNISDKINISTELAYVNTSLNSPFKSDIGDKLGIRALALIKMPNQSIYELDNDGNPTDIYFTPVDAFQGAGSVYYNPVAMANLAKNHTENNRITPTFKFNYKPVDKLTFTSIVNMDINTELLEKFNPEAAIGVTWTNNNANKATVKDSEYVVIRTDSKLIWNPESKNDKHSMFALLSFQTTEKTNQTYQVVTSNTPSSSTDTPITLSELTSANSEYSKYASVATNFRFNYQYLDRYIIDGGVRHEGNSRFGSNYRYGYFPSVAAKWIVSEESFLDSDDIDEFSFRASFGVNGNTPTINYGSYSSYTSYNYQYLDERPVYASSIELSDLRWETVVQQNYGINYSFFDYRLSGDIEYYIKDTYDALTKDPAIPSTSGYNKLLYINQGDINNTGFEFNVNAKLVKTEDFNLDVNFNISRNVNTIERLDDLQSDERGDALDTGSNGYIKRLQEGNAIGSFYGYRYKGVYTNPEDLYARDAEGAIIKDLNDTEKLMRFGNSTAGRLFNLGEAMYEDINHDGRIDRLDVVYLGNSTPLFYGGFGANIKYKNWQLVPFFNYRLKQKMINLGRMATESMDDLDNQSTAVLRRWRYDGQVTDIPSAVYNSPVNTLGSDRFLEDASFVRLKNLTLRYNVPKTYLEKINLNTASLFVTATNLITFTKYSGPDPEAGIAGKWYQVGYDTSQTPISKTITAGLNLSF